MKKSPKNANHELLSKQPEKNSEEGKDYAHYPPASAEQVKPHAHKKHKDGKDADAATGQTVTTTAGQAATADAEKSLNGSNKIVNSVDEAYSDGSGGGFEATEQVND